MNVTPSILKGTIHGKTIELEEQPGLPDGQPVSVLLVLAPGTAGSLHSAFSSWSEDAGELDDFMNQIYQDRK